MSIQLFKSARLISLSLWGSLMMIFSTGEFASKDHKVLLLKGDSTKLF